MKEIFAEELQTKHPVFYDSRDVIALGILFWALHANLTTLHILIHFLESVDNGFYSYSSLAQEKCTF